MGSESRADLRANKSAAIPRWVQSAELIPRPNKKSGHTSVGSECRADPGSKASVHKLRAGPQLGGTQCLTKPRSDEEGVQTQRVVPDFTRVKTAELKPREKRECIKMEPQLDGFRVKNYPTGKEGVHEQREELQTQRVVPDFGRAKRAELSLRAKEGVHKNGTTTRWVQDV